MKNRFVLVIAILAGGTLLGYNACKPADHSSSQNSTVFGNPFIQAVILPFAPARTHVGCLKSVTFTDGEKSGSYTLPSPTPVQFNSSGTDLGELPIEFPSNRIGLEFGPGCESGPIPSGNSFIVNLENISISTNENVNFYFTGFYDPADAPDLDLAFNFQNFIDVFENDSTEEDILGSIEVTIGTFGPMTHTLITPYASTDTHFGCLEQYIVTDINMNQFSVRFGPKVVRISPEGGNFADLGLSPGTYTTILLSYSTSCPDLPGLGLFSAYRVNNSHGSFDLSGLTMRFQGTFTIPEDRNRKIIFDVRPFVDHFSTLTRQQDARARATSAFYLDVTFTPGQ